MCSTLLTSQDSKSNNPFPSHINAECLQHLCKMNPDYAMTIRSEAVQKCCLPELTVKLTLDYHLGSGERQDLVEFVSGLLLGSDVRVRQWFAQFIKTGQKVCLSNYATLLLDEISLLLGGLCPAKQLCFHNILLGTVWFSNKHCTETVTRRIIM